MAVEAVGPQSVHFQALADAPEKLGAVLEVAGSYRLHVCLADAPVVGWPRLLHVLTDESEASKCVKSHPQATQRPTT